MEPVKNYSEALSSELEGSMPFVSSACRSPDNEGGTSLHVSEGESEDQLRRKKMRLTGQYLQGLVEELVRADKLGVEKKNQLDRPTSAEVDSNIPPSSSTDPPPVLRAPPFPKGGTSSQIRNWTKEFKKIALARQKDPDKNLPTVRAPKDHGTADAVQDRRSKQTILAAARSIVSVTAISEVRPTRPQCTGFIIGQYEHSGVVFSVIVTCSAVVCWLGRKLDPLPKLSVGLPDRKTIIEAQLLYFNDHFDVALLLLPMEVSLDIPRLGSCPDYDQEVFVLGRDNKASLGVRHGVISWSEKPNILGRDHYMFLDGEVPEGGTGGPVIDHDGVFRGMAFSLSPAPAVISISIIRTCFEMFIHFGRIARPMLGLSLRTVASLDVECLECLSSDHNIKSGYIVDVVHGDSPAQGCGIRKGNVIVSLNGHDTLTLPELENHLLSLGWKNLSDSVSTLDIKLVVCDLKGQTRSITLPVLFSSTPEHV